MGVFKNNFLITLLVSSLGVQLMAQDGVQFESAQISVNSPCNPVIFKGTKRSEYANTAFLMPRLQLAKTSRGTDALEFLKLSSGEHILQLGLYFPKFSIRNQRINYENYTNAECNYQQILNAINYNVKPEEKVKRIVTLQIRNIGVSIDGVVGNYKVAGAETSILSYEGQIKKIEVPLTQNQVKNTISRLSSDIGFNVNVNFEFMARETNGVAQIELNMSNVASEFKSIIAGNIGVDAEFAKIKLTELQVQKALGTAIARSSTNTNGSIYTEDSTSEAFQTAVGDIYKMIMRKVGENASGHPSTQVTQEDDDCDPRYEDCDDTRGNGGKLPDLPDSPLKPGEDGELGNIVSAQTFYRQLKREANVSFSLQNNSKNIVRTFTSSMLITKDEDDANRFEVSLSSSDSAKNSRYKLNDGDEVFIYPLGEKVYPVSYETQTTYYSAENLNDPAGFKFFSMLDRLNLSKLQEMRTTGGTVAYVDEKKTKWVRSPGQFVKTPVVYTSRYVWGEENLVPVNDKPRVHNFEDILASQDDILDKVDIGFIFSKKSPSRIYTLKELLSASYSFVDVYYDVEKYAFVIKSNGNLGTLRIKNLKKTKVSKIAPRKHFQDVKVKTYFEKFKNKKAKRVYSTHDKVESLPTEIYRTVLQLEKDDTFSWNGDNDLVVPVDVKQGSGGDISAVE